MNTETAPEKLSRLQASFSGHIRDPERVTPPEGIEDRRMEVYRKLFFNNVNGFLTTNFPVLHSLYNKQEWLQLCRDFFRHHRCHTPLFAEIPREFLKYLQAGRKEAQNDPPFMLELAHYEWVELALSLDESEIEDIPCDPNADLLSGRPVLSPLAWPLSYRYPVHRIRKDFQPREAPEQATHLLVWRKKDFSIHFMQLNEVARLLLHYLKEEPVKEAPGREAPRQRTPGHSGLELLQKISNDIQHPRPEIVISAGRNLLEELRDKQVLLGAI
jgi:hypothetical protein